MRKGFTRYWSAGAVASCWFLGAGGAGAAGLPLYDSLCVQRNLVQFEACRELMSAEEEYRTVLKGFTGVASSIGVESYCAFLSTPDRQCDRYLAVYRKRQQAALRVEALGRAPVAIDTPPVLRIAPSPPVPVGTARLAINGLAGDDTGPPIVTVDGIPARVSAPARGEPPLAAHTVAFSIDLEATTPGVREYLVQACDGAGHCVADRVAVQVVAAAPPPPPPAAVPPTRSGTAEEPDVVDAVVERLRQQGLVGEAGDTEAPILEVQAPRSVEVAPASTRITGLVSDRGSPPRVTLDGKPLPLFLAPPEAGTEARHGRQFEFQLDAREAGFRRHVVEACDAAGNCIAEKVVVEVIARGEGSLRGRNFALVIGNDTYRHYPTLRTAVRDATAVADVLSTRYAFDDGAVRLLVDADRRGIFDALAKLREQLEPDDRLLIYYAGHGQIDPVTDEGFWLPVDAEPDSDFTWIDNGDIRRYLRGMPAKHVLVVADSCFSGTLTRGESDYRRSQGDRFFGEIDSHPSRKVITSGGTEPVADSGSGGHSVFANYFLKALRENDKPYLTSFELFHHFVRAVTNNSDQKPNYGTISDAGDEGAGDFTFIRKR